MRRDFVYFDQGALKPPFQARSGFALPGVLLVLALLFTVSVPAILMMEQEWKITEAVIESAEAQLVVEDGLVDLLAVWDSSFFALAVWDDTTVTTSSAGGVVDVRVTRTSPQLFLLEATGLSDEGQATVKSALTVRAGAARIAPRAALTAVTAGLTGATVRGWDEPVPLWTCSGSLEQPHGVVVPDASAFVVGPGGSVYGYPPIQVDSTLVAGTIAQPADVHFKTLARNADVVHPTSFSGQTNPVQNGVNCTTSDLTNWGDANDPLDPCGDYYPIVHVSGSATLSSGSEAQGILLIEGDLIIQGGVRFYGIAIVLGDVHISGAGNDIRGSIVATSAHIQGSLAVSDAYLQGSLAVSDAYLLPPDQLVYSSCAVARVEAAHPELGGGVRPIPSRSTVDLTGS